MISSKAQHSKAVMSIYRRSFGCCFAFEKKKTKKNAMKFREPHKRPNSVEHFLQAFHFQMHFVMQFEQKSSAQMAINVCAGSISCWFVTRARALFWCKIKCQNRESVFLVNKTEQLRKSIEFKAENRCTNARLTSQLKCISKSGDSNEKNIVNMQNEPLLFHNAIICLYEDRLASYAQRERDGQNAHTQFLVIDFYLWLFIYIIYNYSWLLESVWLLNAVWFLLCIGLATMAAFQWMHSSHYWPYLNKLKSKSLNGKRNEL